MFILSKIAYLFILFHVYINFLFIATLLTTKLILKFLLYVFILLLLIQKKVTFNLFIVFLLKLFCSLIQKFRFRNAAYNTKVFPIIKIII